MAREMPARAMRLGPPPRAVRHPPRCALDVYARHGLWWRARGNASRQIVSDHSVCSLQRQGRRAASAVPVSCLASLDDEHTWRVLRHWLPMRASEHYTNRHHPCQSFLLCVAPPLAHLWVQGPRWTPISRESNMLRPTDRHQTTTCQLHLLIFIVEKENSFVCRPYHVGIPRYGCPPRPLHPKMSRLWM